MSVLRDMMAVAGRWDYVRVNVFIALIAGVAMQAVACFGAKNQVFDLVTFGTGIGLILAAGAAASWAKAKEQT